MVDRLAKDRRQRVARRSDCLQFLQQAMELGNPMVGRRRHGWGRNGNVNGKAHRAMGNAHGRDLNVVVCSLKSRLFKDFRAFEQEMQGRTLHNRNAAIGSQRGCWLA